MTDSRRRKGFITIANEIWDEVIRRDFSKRQKDILFFIWRLSYGCDQSVAIIPKQKDFALCGVGAGHIGVELKLLETCLVISRAGTEYCFNEDYSSWQVTPNRGWDIDRFEELVLMNRNGKTKGVKKVTETVTKPDPKTHDESYRNSNFSDNKKLPKQEVGITETVTPDEEKLPKQEVLDVEINESYRNSNSEHSKVTETVISQGKVVTEMGSLTSVDEHIILKSFKDSKDSKDLKDLKDLKDFKSICSFDDFWMAYPRKVGKKAAQNMWDKALKAKVDPNLLTRCAVNYATYCKVKAADDEFILHGSTFLNPKNERYADFEEAPKQTTVAPVNKVQGNSRSDRNKNILQKRMEEARNEQSRGTENFGGSGYSLPHSGTH